MKKDQITSLLSLHTSDVIKEQKDEFAEVSFYIIHQMYQDEETKVTQLKLIRINEHFTKLDITISNEANENGIFISKSDPDFTFRFFKTGFTKKELSEVLIKHINQNVG